MGQPQVKGSRRLSLFRQAGRRRDSAAAPLRRMKKAGHDNEIHFFHRWRSRMKFASL
jgi:hypothetical protein